MEHPELLAQGIMISSSTMIVVAGILPLLHNLDRSSTKLENGIKILMLFSIFFGLLAIVMTVSWFIQSSQLSLNVALGLNLLQIISIGSLIIFLLRRLLRW